MSNKIVITNDDTPKKVEVTASPSNVTITDSTSRPNRVDVTATPNEIVVTDSSQKTVSVQVTAAPSSIVVTNSSDRVKVLQVSQGIVGGPTGPTGATGATGATGPTTYNTTLVTSSSYNLTSDDRYVGISYAGQVSVVLPDSPETGTNVIIKDESGRAGDGVGRRITITGSGSDTIDNDTTAILNINGAALQFVYRDGWRII